VAETLKQCLRLFLETCLMKTSLITINIFLEYLSCALLLELNCFKFSILTLLNFRIRKKYSFEFEYSHKANGPVKSVLDFAEMWVHSLKFSKTLNF